MDKHCFSPFMFGASHYWDYRKNFPWLVSNIIKLISSLTALGHAVASFFLICVLSFFCRHHETNQIWPKKKVACKWCQGNQDGTKVQGKEGLERNSLIENQSTGTVQFSFSLSAHPPLLPPAPYPISSLPAWMGNWISVVSQGSALSELSGRSEVAGQHGVTANLSLGSSG